jgi:hypothetical protein
MVPYNTTLHDNRQRAAAPGDLTSTAWGSARQGSELEEEDGRALAANEVDELYCPGGNVDVMDTAAQTAMKKQTDKHVDIRACSTMMTAIVHGHYYPFTHCYSQQGIASLTHTTGKSDEIAGRHGR